MTTYNTGNPIGSTDARDLYDNAQALDNAINSPSDTYNDRFGLPRKTLKSIESAAETAIEQIELAEFVATTAASSAASSASSAGFAKQQAEAAASVSGSVRFYDTKAAATADLANIPADGIVEVVVDESQNGKRTRYKKEAGALVFKYAFYKDVGSSSGLGAAIRKPKGVLSMVGDSNTDDELGRPGWQSAVDAEMMTYGGVFHGWTRYNIGQNGSQLIGWVNAIASGSQSALPTANGNPWAAVNANPDVIIVSLGTNDLRTPGARAVEGTEVNLRANLAKLVNFFLERTKAVIWLRMPQPMGYSPAGFSEAWVDAAEAREASRRLRQVYREWANVSERVEVYDSHSDLFGDYIDNVSDPKDPYNATAQLMADSLHPNDLGFRRIVQRMSMQADKSYPRDPRFYNPVLRSGFEAVLTDAVWYKVCHIESAIPFNYDGAQPGVLIQLNKYAGLRTGLDWFGNTAMSGSGSIATDQSKAGSIRYNREIDQLYAMGNANAYKDLFSLPGAIKMYFHNSGNTREVRFIRQADTASGDPRIIFRSVDDSQWTESGPCTLFVTDIELIPGWKQPKPVFTATITANNQRFYIPGAGRTSSLRLACYRSGDIYNGGSGGAAQQVKLYNDYLTTAHTEVLLGTFSFSPGNLYGGVIGPFNFSGNDNNKYNLIRVEQVSGVANSYPLSIVAY